MASDPTDAEREALARLIDPHNWSFSCQCKTCEVSLKPSLETADRILAAGYRSPASLLRASDDWRNDPSADERWSAGCDYAIAQLAIVLGTEPSAFSWDAATETLDGDVQAIIGNALVAGLGEDWQDRPDAASLLRAWEMGRDAAAEVVDGYIEVYVTGRRKSDWDADDWIAEHSDVADDIRALTPPPDLMQRGLAGDMGGREAPESLIEQLRPEAWIIPGDDGTGKLDGWLDAMVHQEGEFSKPLYSAGEIRRVFRSASSGERRAPASPAAEIGAKDAEITDLLP